MRVRELYRALPPAAEDPEAVAVIIGNRSYDRLPRSVTSYNDADTVGRVRERVPGAPILAKPVYTDRLAAAIVEANRATAA